jgi:hypothetical protein
MSRSRRKTPIFGIATVASERQDKDLWHRRFRLHERLALVRSAGNGFEAHQTVLAHDVSDPWAMGRDGHRYFSTSDQVRKSEQRASRTEADLGKRDLLMRRYMRKAMSK